MEHYEKIRVVGRGSHGLVTLCRRKEDNRLVILKEVAIDHLTDAEKEATLNEVEVLSKLNHPNVIAYFDNFIHESSVKIVMEYANKGSLHDYLQSQNGTLLNETDVTMMFSQIVQGLHYIHSLNILHRDLKTQNIFVLSNPSLFVIPALKIGDFGISKVLMSQSKASTVLGTPSYLSPELCQGQMYDEHSDIWALGCVLYEMLTLRKAFEAPVSKICNLALKLRYFKDEVKDKMNFYPFKTLASLVMKIIHRQVTP